jgi:hypothetical protein
MMAQLMVIDLVDSTRQANKWAIFQDRVVHLSCRVPAPHVVDAPSLSDGPLPLLQVPRGCLFRSSRADHDVIGCLLRFMTYLISITPFLCRVMREQKAIDMD